MTSSSENRSRTRAWQARPRAARRSAVVRAARPPRAVERAGVAPGHEKPAGRVDDLAHPAHVVGDHGPPRCGRLHGHPGHALRDTRAARRRRRRPDRAGCRPRPRRTTRRRTRRRSPRRDSASRWSVSTGPTWTKSARPCSDRASAEEVQASLLAHQSAHHEHDGARGDAPRAARWRGEAVEHHAVADEAELAPADTHMRPRQDLLVLAALDEHEVGPRTAPPLEQPSHDVGEPAVVAEVQRAVDGVDGGGARSGGPRAGPGTRPSGCGSGRSRSAGGGSTATVRRTRRSPTGRIRGGWARPRPRGRAGASSKASPDTTLHDTSSRARSWCPSRSRAVMDVVTTRHPRRTAEPRSAAPPVPPPGGPDVGPIPVRPSPTCARVQRLSYKVWGCTNR